MLGVIYAAAVLTAPTPAAPPPAAVATATASAAVRTSPRDADPIVCHTEAGEGSRITHKVCMRASEIAERRLDARQTLGRMQGGFTPPMDSMGPMH